MIEVEEARTCMRSMAMLKICLKLSSENLFFEEK
jgi:hypothetical protein